MADRPVSWIELFFDLVFVAASHQTVSLIKDNHPAQSLSYVVLFLPILWIWIGHTMYTNRFPAEDYMYTIITIVHMLGVITLAQAVLAIFTGGSFYFGIAYGITRISLLILYLKEFYSNPDVAEEFKIPFIGFSISAVLWIISPFSQFTAYIWIIAFFIDIISPAIANKDLAKMGVDSSHLPERVSLLTIIMLGEMIIALVTGTSINSPQKILVLLAGFGVITGIAMSYFKFVEACAIGKVKGAAQLYLYSHFAMFVSLLLLASGYKGLITGKDTIRLVYHGMLLFVCSYFIIVHAFSKKQLLKNLLNTVAFAAVIFIFYYIPFFIEKLYFISLLFLIYLLLMSYVRDEE